MYIYLVKENTIVLSAWRDPKKADEDLEKLESSKYSRENKRLPVFYIERVKVLDLED